MASKTFKQYDSRWGSKNYNGSSTMAAAGCGPTACADLIYNIDPTITPWKTATYMKQHGYAIRNAGTAWAGIPACLKAFGMKQVVNQPTMSKAFDAMEKGHLAVILFRGGTRGGITWTGGGHYLAATDIKIKDGKHYLYMRDPGQRDHDGWYCYETTMKGLIPQIWTATFDPKDVKKVVVTKTTYKGSYPTATISRRTGTTTNKKRWQQFLSWWGTDVDIDGIFGSDTESKTKKFQKTYGLTQDGIVGPKTIKKAKKIGKKEKH